MTIDEIALKVAQKMRKESEYDSIDLVCNASKFAHALLAELAKQVPDFRGYAALGTGQYLLNACPATDTLPAELVISVATEEEKIGRVIGDLKDVDPGTEIAPDKMAVRLAFFSVAGLDALEQQLRILRYESFPESAPIPPAVPEGWKLVPIGPTEEMELRGAEATDSIDWGDAQDDAPYELATKVYKAMLAAAPTPKEES